MITPTQMYWITRLDGINEVGIFLIILASTALLVGPIIMELFNDFIDEKKLSLHFRSIFKWALPTFLFGLAIVTFVPSTKQMAAILLIPGIVNNEKIQQTGNKLYDLAVEWMDELRPNAAKNKENEK